MPFTTPDGTPAAWSFSTSSRASNRRVQSPMCVSNSSARFRRRSAVAYSSRPPHSGRSMAWHNARHCSSDATLRTHQLSSPAQGNAP